MSLQGVGQGHGELPTGDTVIAAGAHARALADDAAGAALGAVTLIVYGWKVVEPGTLWWVFPSVAAALVAARAMTNAVKWAIVLGPPRGAIVDIASARAAGSVLVEQTAASS
jgi:hypothetical protein